MQAEIYPQIFKKHAVSDSFYTSLFLYETHPEQLKILMDSLTSVFTKLQSAAVLLEGDESKGKNQLFKNKMKLEIIRIILSMRSSKKYGMSARKT
ncbi:MAG: hypothetical protein IPN93_09635 [Bacteroidetes bacterium]|nr:hypothetical protein [Bacteroidota bacterium]